jgi:hypothetical protein
MYASRFGVRRFSLQFKNLMRNDLFYTFMPTTHQRDILINADECLAGVGFYIYK